MYGFPMAFPDEQPSFGVANHQLLSQDWLGHSSEESSTALNNIMMRLSKVGWISE